MPDYTCTTARGTLPQESKASLAAEITRIHAAINHVPPAYVDVVFAEQPPETYASWTSSGTGGAG
ncbi:tautomerase family protein [Streptomyces sp. NBC_01478]|uniref:tautomerase family protein n=1 Tax=Streptomyces sp. NBC_01478 TaxID=2903882 RepID=UPI002E33BE90|nr:tautomerase family protein [Streptomyces sp. NBC_01478]